MKILWNVKGGSSPLSRGIRQRHTMGVRHPGIIPALAGNTPRRPSLPGRSWDHPRSRGEYNGLAGIDSYRSGSSPLSRGILCMGAVHILCRRIIPALAGNTWVAESLARTWADHPRSRGEYYVDLRLHICRDGSSPLSRGIPFRNGTERGARRIIPALAGNTTPQEPHTSIPRDHPRSRGEYFVTSTFASPAKGSSPLSRGIQSRHPADTAALGIIPALAGNTPTRSSGLPACWDHPRSRGEYRVGAPHGHAFFGSSPLSRGIRRHRGVSDRCRGIIPALAGNTHRRSRGRCRRRDHPRSRGEYTLRQSP